MNIMNKKDRFLKTVESLCDHWPVERSKRTLSLAGRYEEELLPENTGMAALQFVCGVMPIKGLVTEYALPGTGGR